MTKPENGDILLTETRNYTFKCRREPEGCRWRIVNPVEIRNGTATVSVEVSAWTKVGHWETEKAGADAHDA